MAAPAIFAAMNPAAIYILVICAVGGLAACGAFVWAALKGEFTDAAEAAMLVFDADDERPERERP